MKSFISTIALVAVLTSAHAENWRIGSFAIQWLDGFHRTPNKTTHRFVRPDGVVVLVSAMGLRRDGDREKLRSTYLDFGRTKLPKLSSSKGTDVMKLKEEVLHNGITLFTTAAKVEKGVKTF